MRDWCVRCLVREGDSAEDAHVKKVAFPVCLLLFLFSGWAAMTSFFSSRFAFTLGAGIGALGPAVFVVGVLVNAVKARYLIDVVLVVNTVGLCVMDLAAAAVSATFRPWSLIVLVLDAALVFKRNHVPLFAIPFTLLYIAIETLESIQSFGLHDLGYWGTGVEISDCNCASPPCAVTVMGGCQGFMSICAVFLIDFYFTQGFASTMRLQLRRVEVSVEVVAEIAAALARYDVDAAANSIQNGQGLPEEIAESFRRLLSNLRSYRD
eukprot:Hpha_TRINITY_DN16254_c2_g2::TRINITY_DN16254_c2_g2_i1::g.13845::m.13845